MRMSCLKIAGARRLLRMLSGCVHSVVEVSQEMAIELRRLNSARLGEDEREAVGGKRLEFIGIEMEHIAFGCGTIST